MLPENGSFTTTGRFRKTDQFRKRIITTTGQYRKTDQFRKRIKSPTDQPSTTDQLMLSISSLTNHLSAQLRCPPLPLTTTRDTERVSRQGEDGSWDLLSTTHDTHLLGHDQHPSPVVKQGAKRSSWVHPLRKKQNEDNRYCRVAVLTHRSTKKRKKKPTLDRAWIGPWVAPRREAEEERHTSIATRGRGRGREGETHTNSYEGKRSEGKEKQTNRAYLLDRRTIVKWNFPLNDTGIYTVVGSTRRERDQSRWLVTCSLVHSRLTNQKNRFSREKREIKNKEWSLSRGLVLGKCIVDDRWPRIVKSTSRIFLVSGRSHRWMPSHMKVDPLKSSHRDAERERNENAHRLIQVSQQSSTDSRSVNGRRVRSDLASRWYYIGKQCSMTYLFPTAISRLDETTCRTLTVIVSFSR